MDGQDRENWEDGPLTDRKKNQENLDAQESYAIKRKQDQEIINPPEPIMRGPTAGSASSSRKILVRIKKPSGSPEKEVAPPPQAAEVEGNLPAEEKKTHYCKECDKTFSSGKALGGHMSSAHVQASKDYSVKKLKSKTTVARAQLRSSGLGPGTAENECAICGKRFPSQKSLYGHMRCHPDREWRGMEPPSEPRVESETSTGPGLNPAMGPDLEVGQNGDMDSRPDGEAQTVDFTNALRGGWPVKDRRGRPARPVSAIPSKNQDFSSSDEEEAVWAGHELLRLLKRNLDSSGKETGGEIDQGELGIRSSGNRIGFENHALACNGDDMVDFKNDKRDYDSSVKKEVACGSEANHGPGQTTLNSEKAHDSKRQKTNSWVHTNGTVQSNGKEKVKMGDNKGKGMKDGDDTESENDLLLTAIRVLANGKRENHHNQSNHTSDFQKPIVEEKSGQVKPKDSLGHSSPDKYACSLCQKAFPSHQALGGHKSSHNKFKMNIVNTADHISTLQDKNKAKNNGHEQQQLPAQLNKDEEKFVRGFDLNMMPDNDDGD